jgi:hypothetical protein
MKKEDQITLDHLLIQQGAPLVGSLHVPQLSPTQTIPNIKKCLPINIIDPKDGLKLWGHCFVKDVHQNKFWNDPLANVAPLQKLEGMISTDYSLYRDYSTNRQKWNCYRNRIIAYFWQQKGINVIPTASWSTQDSFEWCWEGLPQNSVLAITTNGISTDKEGLRHFILGLDEMIQRQNPIALVVCGHFFPWMEDKYPDIQMIKIPSYGQLWNEKKKMREQTHYRSTAIVLAKAPRLTK